MGSRLGSRAALAGGLLAALLAGAGAPMASGGLITEQLQPGGLTAMDLVTQLLGAGADVANVSYTGAERAAGTFSGGEGIVGVASGVVLSTGDIANVAGPNIPSKASVDNAAAGDADLSTLVPGSSTLDAAVLEFDYRPFSDSLALRAVFASEEYNEYVQFAYTDVFGFFVMGPSDSTPVNWALVPGTGIPIAVNTINGDPGNPYYAITSGYYIDNQIFPDSPVDIGMDGLTVVMTLTAPVTPGEWHHVKLAIGDAGDRLLDSAVFIASAAPAADVVPEPATLSLLALGGAALALRRRRRDREQPLA